MPEPRDNEEKDDFISRCMSDTESVEDFPDEDQRLAFCQSQWDNREGDDMEEASLQNEYIPLKESVSRGDNLMKLIEPGWGSSGYYSKEVLERDGPKVFTEGTKMYWNHPTKREEQQRPEGDLRFLAAELKSDAEYLENGPDGPGLYANAKIFEQYKKPIKDMAEHIGLSIRAGGKRSPGEAEGKRGPIIEQITYAKSVDFVTEAGAGGKVVELFESINPHRKAGVAVKFSNVLKHAETIGLEESPNKELIEKILNREQSMSAAYENTRARISSAVRDKYGDEEGYSVWVKEIFDSEQDVIFQDDNDGKMYRASYAIEEEEVMIGDREEVKVVYVTDDEIADDLTPESLKKDYPDLVESIRKEEKQKLYGSKAKLKEDKQMSEEKLEELKESLENEKKEKARLQEKLLLREAKDIVAEKLADKKLPEITKNRLLESLSQNPPTEDGEINKEEFNEAIDEAIKEEVEYLSEATGSGSIKGMGESETDDLDEAKLDEELESELSKLGAKI